MSDWGLVIVTLLLPGGWGLLIGWWVNRLWPPREPQAELAEDHGPKVINYQI
jgi:hypothetical protein